MSAKVVELPREDASSGFSIDGPDLVLIPDGTYELGFTHHLTRRQFKDAGKLELWFRIISFGDYFELPICRYYNASRLWKPGRGGRFSVLARSDFNREYCRLFGKPDRRDRVPMRAFRQNIVIGRTRTVKIDSRQRKLPPELCYSVIGELIRIKDR